MLVAFAILILLIVALVLVVLQWREEEFKFANFLAGGAAILAWVLLLIVHARLPIKLTLQALNLENFFPNSPALLMDNISWAFALSLVGFGGAVVFSNRKRVQLLPAWTLSMIAVGTLAAFSANPITLLYTWTLIDVLMFLGLLYGASDGMQWTEIVNSFTLRLLSLVFIMGAGLIAYRQGVPLTFAAIPPSASPYLIAAAVLHLGIWLPSSSFEHIREFEPVLRITPAATSLMLIARTAEAGLPPSLQSTFLYFIIGAALWGGLAWAFSNTAQTSLRPWILGMGALSIGAALLGYPHASLAWAMALFLGSLPFLVPWSTSVSVLSLLCFLGLTALPFSPTWAGSKIYHAGGWGLLLGVAQGLLAGGYLKLTLERHKTRVQLESWEILPPLLGLALLPVTQVVVSLLGGGMAWDAALGSGAWGVSLLAWGVVASVMVWNHFSISIPEPFTRGLSTLGLIPRLIWQALKILYGFFGRFLNILTAVFEGEGGVIWTLLGAFLLITILASLRGG